FNRAMSLVQPADKAQPRRRPITRRTVLAGAVATGAGVAAIRLWGGAALEQTLHAVQPRQLSGRMDWVSPLKNDQAKVNHLLRRATFGATPQELEHAL